MHNQPALYRLEYSPVNWPEDFPLVHYRWEQPDREIIKLHGHNGLEVGYCFEGSGIFVVESKVFAFHPGDMVFINDREMHFARSTAGTTSRWAYLCFDPAGLIGPTGDEPDLLNVAKLGGPNWQNVLSSREHPRLGQIIQSIMRELDEQPPGYRSAVRGMAWTMLALLHRLPGRDTSPPRSNRALHRVAPALEHIAAHYCEEIDIPHLARVCNLSTTHFRRLFNQATGESPKQYLVSVRMRMAGSLLRNTDRSVLEIALAVGYPTLSNFNRQFRSAFGCSPRQHRHQTESDSRSAG